MAYDQYLAERITRVLKQKHIAFEELKMMGGLCFKVDNKMLCGIHIDKATGNNMLMARVGEETYKKQIAQDNVMPMDFTGRPMVGYIFVLPEGFDNETDLEKWIQFCLDFNPNAKSSKKKKAK